MGQKWTKNVPKLDQKCTNMDQEMDQKLTKNCPKRQKIGQKWSKMTKNRPKRAKIFIKLTTPPSG